MSCLDPQTLFQFSIVIPTFNERENIGVLIPELAEVFSDVAVEILVVDDQSPDGTQDEARKLAGQGFPVRIISKEKREGIGAALRVGYNAANGTYIGSTDADLSFSPKDLRRLYDRAQSGIDLVTGSRHSNKGFYETPSISTALKYLISKTGNFVVRTLARMPLRDVSANLRVIRRDVWNAIKTEDKSNFLLFEMISKTWLLGYSIEELPVSFMDRRFGSSKLHLGSEAPKFLLKLFFYLIKNAGRVYGRRPVPVIETSI